MAVQEARHHLITAALTDEERDLLEAFAAEQRIEDVSTAVPALLHELVRLHDALWDAQFAQSTAPLHALARQALEEDRAGDPRLLIQTSPNRKTTLWINSILSMQLLVRIA